MKAIVAWLWLVPLAGSVYYSWKAVRLRNERIRPLEKEARVEVERGYFQSALLLWNQAAELRSVQLSYVLKGATWLYGVSITLAALRLFW